MRRYPTTRRSTASHAAGKHESACRPARLDTPLRQKQKRRSDLDSAFKRPTCTKTEPCRRARTPDPKVLLWSDGLPEHQSTHCTP
jgi:hypothetical protein